MGTKDVVAPERNPSVTSHYNQMRNCQLSKIAALAIAETKPFPLFLHMQTPPGSNVSASHQVDPYRGCTMKCVYCNMLLPECVCGIIEVLEGETDFCPGCALPRHFCRCRNVGADLRSRSHSYNGKMAAALERGCPSYDSATERRAHVKHPDRPKRFMGKRAKLPRRPRAERKVRTGCPPQPAQRYAECDNMDVDQSDCSNTQLVRAGVETDPGPAKRAPKECLFCKACNAYEHGQMKGAFNWFGHYAFEQGNPCPHMLSLLQPAAAPWRSLIGVEATLESLRAWVGLQKPGSCKPPRRTNCPWDVCSPLPLLLDEMLSPAAASAAGPDCTPAPSRSAEIAYQIALAGLGPSRPGSESPVVRAPPPSPTGPTTPPRNTGPQPGSPSGPPPPPPPAGPGVPPAPGPLGPFVPRAARGWIPITPPGPVPVLHKDELARKLKLARKGLTAPKALEACYPIHMMGPFPDPTPVLDGQLLSKEELKSVIMEVYGEGYRQESNPERAILDQPTAGVDLRLVINRNVDETGYRMVVETLRVKWAGLTLFKYFLLTCYTLLTLALIFGLDSDMYEWDTFATKPNVSRWTRVAIKFFQQCLMLGVVSARPTIDRDLTTLFGQFCSYVVCGLSIARASGAPVPFTLWVALDALNFIVTAYRWYKYDRARLVYIPHLVDIIVTECSGSGQNSDTLATNAKLVARRCATLPVPDKCARGLVDGSVSVACALIMRRSQNFTRLADFGARFTPYSPE